MRIGLQGVYINIARKRASDLIRLSEGALEVGELIAVAIELRLKVRVGPAQKLIVFFDREVMS